MWFNRSSKRTSSSSSSSSSSSAHEQDPSTLTTMRAASTYSMVMTNTGLSAKQDTSYASSGSSSSSCSCQCHSESQSVVDRDVLSSMSSRLLKEYLALLGKQTDDLFEKSEIVERLVAALNAAPTSMVRHIVYGEPLPDEDRLRCKICLERDFDCVLLPCGHLCACEQCIRAYFDSSSERVCIVCRATVSRVVKVYM
jgi:Zinc finger, C3HC4 type (RING finger)